jgi:nicotinamide-nucleotide amidase
MGAVVGVRRKAQYAQYAQYTKIKPRVLSASTQEDSGILDETSMLVEVEKIRVLAIACGLTVGTGESLTGGMLMSLFTAVAGSSAVFHASAVTYTDAVKQIALGVRRRTLLEHTAVSAQTAAEMAAGVVAKFAVDIGVSLTGFAGPTGDRKGEVWIGLAGPHGRFVVQQHNFGDHLTRHEVRLRSCAAAIDMLHDALKDAAHSCSASSLRAKPQSTSHKKQEHREVEHVRGPAREGLSTVPGPIRV